jgi:hypothetical protein
VSLIVGGGPAPKTLHNALLTSIANCPQKAAPLMRIAPKHLRARI